ncbi:MAG: hypothetical protein KDM63_09765 [Verrucomicrobiae bacterium]|nr:hypothetical protein [Verrucomicrobiae bacterium]
MGNSPQKLFFYQGTAGLADGPLPLSEIERFVEIGALSAGLQIREQGQEAWRPLMHEPFLEEIPVATKVSEGSTRPNFPNRSKSVSAKPSLKGAPRLIFGERIEGWVGCAVALIVSTAFYMVLMQPFFKLIEWLYDKLL